MAEPVVRKGKAQDIMAEQLPQGAATELNEANAAIPDENVPPPAGRHQQENFADQGPPEGVTFDTRPQDLGNLADEEDQILFGPTERPEEPITAGFSQKLPPPDDIFDWLPYLITASRDPHAGQGVRQLLRSIVSHLGG